MDAARTPSRGRFAHFWKPSTAVDVCVSTEPLSPEGIHEAEVDQTLLDVACGWLLQLGRLDGCCHRLAEVVTGEQADGDATFDEHAHSAHARDPAQGANELADTLLEQPLVAAGREAGTEVDRDDPVGHGDRAERGRARHGGAKPGLRSAELGPTRSCCTVFWRVVLCRVTDTGFPSARNHTFAPAPAEPARTSATTTRARNALHFIAIRFGVEAGISYRSAGQTGTSRPDAIAPMNPKAR